MKIHQFVRYTFRGSRIICCMMVQNINHALYPVIQDLLLVGIYRSLFHVKKEENYILPKTFGYKMIHFLEK